MLWATRYDRVSEQTSAFRVVPRPADACPEGGLMGIAKEPFRTPEDALAYRQRLKDMVAERKRIDDETERFFKRQTTDEFGFPVQKRR